MNLLFAMAQSCGGGKKHALLPLSKTSKPWLHSHEPHFPALTTIYRADVLGLYMNSPFQVLNLSPMHWSIKQRALRLGLCWLRPSPHLVSESSWRDHQLRLSIHTDVLKCYLGGTQEHEEMGQILPKQTNTKCSFPLTSQ